MTKEELIGLLPEDKREEAKALIDPLAGIDSIEKGISFMKSNSVLNSAFDSAVSKAVASAEKRIIEEKLPAKLAEELEKANPKRQPWEIEIEKLKKESAEKDRISLLRERKLEAVKALSGANVPPTFLDFLQESLLTSDDFEIGIKQFSEAMTAYRESAIAEENKKRFGNTGAPTSGKGALDLEAQYTKALADGNVALAMKLKSELAKQ